MQLVIQVGSEKNGSCDEWVIIELQGDLETRNEDVSLQGKFIGDLHFTDKNIPVLIIGHHILYGKAVQLEKPMVVLQKSRTFHHDDDELNVSGMSSSSPTSRTGEVGQRTATQKHSSNDVTLPSDEPHYLAQAVIRKKLLFKTRAKPIVSTTIRK